MFGLTQTMQQASMAQPPSPINAAPVIANESSADAAAASEAAANYTIKYEEATAHPTIRTGMIVAEEHEAKAVEFKYGVSVTLTLSMDLKNGTAGSISGHRYKQRAKYQVET